MTKADLVEVVAKKASLTAKVETSAQGKRIVLIFDSQQNIVRRLTETQLGTAFLLQNKDDKGGLIDQSA